MKLSRSLLLIVSAILFIAFVGGVAYKFSEQMKQKKLGADMLSYLVQPEQTTVSVGEKVKVPVYLTGEAVESATAFDIKVAYDKTKLRLDKAEPATFFEKPLTVKWDPKQAWFALATTPADPQPTPHTDQALVVLEFTALAKAEKTVISTSDSTVYVAKTGGFSPKAGNATLTIE